MIKIRQHTNNSVSTQRVDFAKMTKGIEVISGAVIELDRFKRSNYRQTFIDSEAITAALENQDIKFLRGLSEYYDGVSGIYSRFCKYLAGLLTFDWYGYPYMLNDKYNSKTVKKEMNEVLFYLDNLNIKDQFYEISLKVIKQGAFYGYMVNSSDDSTGSILELPILYCRSRYKFNGMDAVEFNIKYFDEQIKDSAQREILLDSFPKEFLKAYSNYKNGIITIDRTDGGAWFLLDLNLAMRFAFSDLEIPVFASVIPSLVSLEEAKEIDMKKSMQELMKIVIQKMPLDKNSEMVFDVDEAKDLHNNACNMLQNAVNVDVLTTFAEVQVANLDSSSGSTIKDPLVKVERSVFNEAGISPMLFATDGNLSLEKSIINDESLMFVLLNQYQNKLNGIIDYIFNSKNLYKMAFLKISHYNKDKMQKMYIDMATKGYSKLLPIIAAGLSQTEFLSLNEYENSILELTGKMEPLQMSSTQSSSSSTSSNKVGAPSKGDDVAEKTILNKESQA